MPVSKRMRFEVFKRDGFVCQYCGQHPPNALLEVDHINPKSCGGSNDINNLITACIDCNRGKSNVTLTRIPKKLKTDIVTIKEKEVQLREYNKVLAGIRRREDRDIECIAAVFSEYFVDYHLKDSFKNTTLRRFIRALPAIEVKEAMEIACHYLSSKSPHEYSREDAIRYFCGICWKKIRGEHATD